MWEWRAAARSAKSDLGREATFHLQWVQRRGVKGALRGLGQMEGMSAGEG